MLADESVYIKIQNKSKSAAFEELMEYVRIPQNTFDRIEELMKKYDVDMNFLIFRISVGFGLKKKAKGKKRKL